MGPYMMRHDIRRPYPGQRFFFGGPFVGGLLGGLVGTAIFRPRPPFYPYGGYPYGYGYGGGYGSPYGYGYGGGYGPPYGGGYR
jgi:hypothetical protein